MKAAIAVMCLYNHQSVEDGLSKTAFVFEPPSDQEQKAFDEIDKFLGEICSSTGKSFASLPNHLLQDSVNAYIQEIESGFVKIQSKASILKKLRAVSAICDDCGFSSDTDVLSHSEKDSKGWEFSSNNCVGVMTSIDEYCASVSNAKLPSGAVRFQICEAVALQALQCVSQVNVLFQRTAVKFSMEKGLGSGKGFSGQIEVLKDLSKDGTDALKTLVVGERDETTSDLMGEMNQEVQDRQETWLRERGNTALIQCINDCQCLHEMLLRRVGVIIRELLPAPVAAVLGDLSRGDYIGTNTIARELNTLVHEAYEQCSYPLPEELGLNAFEGVPPNMTAMSHFRRPLMQMEVIWQDMCKILANRIGLGLEDLLNRFLKKMVYRLQPEIQDRKDQYEEHCKQFYALVNGCMEFGDDVRNSVASESKGRRDRDALLINISDDLIRSFFSQALVGLIDNMRHVVEICLVQDLYALITQILSTMLRDKCRYCVSPSQFGGLSKYFRAILQGFEDLFLGRHADRGFSALSKAWVDNHTAFLKEEIVLMAIDSTQLIRIANAPPDSMDDKTSFGTSRSQIAAGILIARKSDKKATQYALDTSSKTAQSVDLIEAALLGRLETKSDKNEHGFVAQSLSKTYKKGWMVKEGQMQKSWKKRWFVLQGQELSYFDDQAELKQKGFVRLSSDTQVLPMQRPKKAGYSLVSQVIVTVSLVVIEVVSCFHVFVHQYLTAVVLKSFFFTQNFVTFSVRDLRTLARLAFASSVGAERCWLQVMFDL